MKFYRHYSVKQWLTLKISDDKLNALITAKYIFLNRISTCGNGISQNCTYITNPSYPSTYTTAGTCTHSVTPLNDGNFIITDVSF